MCPTEQLGVKGLGRVGGNGGVQLLKEVPVHQPRVWKRRAGGRGAGRPGRVEGRGENQAIKEGKGKKRDRRRERERNERTEG